MKSIHLCPDDIVIFELASIITQVSNVCFFSLLPEGFCDSDSEMAQHVGYVDPPPVLKLLPESVEAQVGR